MLTDSVTARDAATSFLAKAGLTWGEYQSVHVRFGDEHHQKPEVTKVLLIELNHLLEDGAAVVLFSDKPDLLPDMSANQNVHVRFHKGVHSAKSGGSALEDALTDLLLMGQSMRIFSLSRYAWGSGFAVAASILYDVPLFQKVAFRKAWDMPEFSK